MPYSAPNFCVRKVPTKRIRNGVETRIPFASYNPTTMVYEGVNVQAGDEVEFEVYTWKQRPGEERVGGDKCTGTPPQLE